MSIRLCKQENKYVVIATTVYGSLITALRVACELHKPVDVDAVTAKELIEVARSKKPGRADMWRSYTYGQKVTRYEDNREGIIIDMGDYDYLVLFGLQLQTMQEEQIHG